WLRLFGVRPRAPCPRRAFDPEDARSRPALHGRVTIFPRSPAACRERVALSADDDLVLVSERPARPRASRALDRDVQRGRDAEGGGDEAASLGLLEGFSR